MSESDLLVHSENPPSEQAGELLHLPRERAEWEWMSFFVRRLGRGDVYRADTNGEEAAFVLVGGTCHVDGWEGAEHIGKRKNGFDGSPYALHLPTGNAATSTA